MNYIALIAGGIAAVYVIQKITSSAATNAVANSQPLVQSVPTYVATGNSGTSSSNSVPPTVSNAVDSATIGNLTAQDNAILKLNNLTSNLLVNNQIQTAVDANLASALSTLQTNNAQQTNLTQLGIASSGLLQSGISAPAGSDTASTTFTPSSNGGFSTTVNYATSGLQSLYDAATNKINELTGTVTSQNQIIQSGTQTIADLSGRVSQDNAIISGGTQTIANLSQQAQDLQNQLASSNASINGLQGKVDALKNLGATAAHIAATSNPAMGLIIQNQFNNA